MPLKNLLGIGAMILIFLAFGISSVHAAEPAITITSPTNATYATTSIDLNWSANETLDWAGYELNGVNLSLQTNYTFYMTLTSDGGSAESVYADDDYIYCANNDGNVYVWNRTNMSIHTTLTEGTSYMYWVYADDDYIYTANDDSKVRVYNRTNMSLHTTLPTAGLWINSVYADSDYIYGASGDNNIHVWNRTNMSLHTLLAHSNKFLSVYADDDYIYGGNLDNNIRVYNRTNMSLHGILTGGTGGMESVHADDDYIYGGNFDDKAYVWNRTNMSIHTTLATAGSAVEAVYRHSNRIYGSATGVGVYVWSRTDMSLYTIISSTIKGVYADDDYIYGGGGSGEVNLWDNTKLFNTTITTQEGPNTLYVWANDTTGSMNYTKVVFYVNTTPPLLLKCSEAADWSEPWPETLAFHMLEEENRTAMNATMEITLWLRNDSSEYNYSFKFENNDTHHICIYPSWEEYEVDATIEYYETGYTRRNYFLSNATINNVTSDINLYLLSSASATDTKFTVKDVYHNLQDDVIIRAQRFYTDSNEYIAVAMGRTGFDGVAGIPLKHNTWYRYILERDYQVLRTFNPMYLTEAELELYLTVEESVEYFDYYQSLAYSCRYNNDTLYLVCIVSDTSGKMVEVVLMVEERKPVGSWENVCLNSSISSSTTLTCDLSGHQNKTLQYALRGRFCCSQETYFTMATGTLDLSSAAILSFGIIGVLMAFFLVITMGFVGIWNPAVGIIFMVFALFISIYLGLVTGSPEIYTSFIALAVSASLIVYKLKV